LLFSFYILNYVIYNVTVIIENDDSGYFAYCPELKGCISQGDTFEAAMSNIKEVIKLYSEVI